MANSDTQQFSTSLSWKGLTVNDRQPLLATKWRHAVAMGVSPWNQNLHHATSPKGTTGSVTQLIHIAPTGLCDRRRPSVPGLAHVAKSCCPFGTNMLTPGRYVGAEEVEDDGVPFAEKVATTKHYPIATEDSTLPDRTSTLGVAT
ncbi:hypothetical protein Rcae01_02153 [Novipirellula caenicola]|uniref:Uncharacterized protein n=1 Tax=Novipirellula caenicola TaxID=1536901 RepID=A0ABP9VND2_9BACT